MSYKPFTTEYTWKIIDDIKEYLEETNKDQTTLDTLDLFHLIGEIEELNDKNRELFNKNKQLKTQLQQKENIIKEVREKLNTQLAFTSSYQLNYQSAMNIIEEAKQILDKGE